MPRIGLFADRPAALAGDAARLGQGVAQCLIVRIAQDPEPLRQGQAVALAIGAELAVEAIMAAVDPEAEAALLMNAIAALRIAPKTLLIAPEREFRTSPTGFLPPGQVTTDTLVAAIRARGFQGRILAGTPSFFPEFNRNPPGALADAVYFGGCGIVHAADDVSVMETLSVYPAILATAQARANTRPLWLGPCTIAPRHAPYGPDVFANPDLKRIAMAGIDPRHAALFGAAYAVGLAAHCATGAVEMLTLAAPFGPFGLLNADGSPRPIMAVQTALSHAAASPAVSMSIPGLTGLAWQTGDSHSALIANISDTPVTADLPATSQHQRLGPHALWEAASGGPMTLGPYRTALITQLALPAL